MVQKNHRYYLAIGIGQYIVEGHTKSEAVEEFNISRRQLDRNLEYLESCNSKLYILAKRKLDQNRYSRAQKICEYISSGHTRSEASEQFSVSVSTIDKAVETIHEKNPDLYKKTKEQLMKNMSTSHTPTSISV